MLITRRQFVSATAAAALGAGVARPHAASWDLVVQGGRVIDPSLGIDAVRDVAIAGGRIAAVEPGLDAGEAQVVNASGRIVVPGLIDVHTHYAREAQGPRICLEDGVTAWVDAGSAGADAIDDQVAVARAAPQQGRLLVNIGRQGILPGGDTMDLDLADVGAAREAIARHRDYVVGVKARLSRNVAADDVEVLRRTQAAASAFDLPAVERPGGFGSLNATGANFRRIIDLADPDRSVASNAPGQSAQPGSPYYGNLAPNLGNGEYFPLLYTRGAVEERAAHRLMLRPAED